MKKILIIFFTLLAVLTFSSKTLINLSLPTVKTEQIVIGSLTEIIEGVGAVEAKGISSLYSLNDSIVKKIYKKSGDWCDKDELIVRFHSKKWEKIIDKHLSLPKGDLINKILDSELKLFYEEIELEEENLSYLIDKNKIYNKLFESGSTSKYELDKLNNEVKQKKYKIKLLYNSLENKKEAIKEDILKSLIFSNKPGQIININITEGEYNLKKSALFSIKSDNTKYYFRVELPTNSGSLLNPGDKIKLTFTTTDRKAEIITYIRSENTDGRTYYLFSFEDNFDGIVGESGEIYYKKSLSSEGLLVPLTSLRQEKNSYYLWKIEHVDGPIGDSYRINKKYINIIKKGIYYASAEGDFNEFDRVVISSDSILSDHDSVYIND